MHIRYSILSTHNPPRCATFPLPAMTVQGIAAGSAKQKGLRQMFIRSRFQVAIDEAHSDIAAAEMAILHAFTGEARKEAEAELVEAQHALAHAIARREAAQAEED